MDSMTLAPTPNWFLNQVMTVNHDCSLVAYCVRTDIVIMRNAYANNAFGVDYKTIKAAHKERSAGCVFSPVTDVNKPFYRHLVSFGDEGAVKMWNMADGQCIMVNNAHIKQIESGHKVMGIDWLKTDPHVIVSVSDNSVVIRWALESNTVKQYNVRARVFPQCLAGSPHDKDIVAIGAKCGFVVLFSMKADHGVVLGKVRCMDNDIMCLSWCPVPTDVISKSDSQPKYLVAGSKDYGVHIVSTNHPSKMKNDCAKLVANVHLPRCSMTKQNARFGKLHMKDHGWSMVCWAGPHTIVNTTSFAEVIKFQTEPLQTSRDGALQFKFKLVHDKHRSKPILCLACPQTRELDPSFDQVIWTLAVDRHLIRFSLQQHSLSLNLYTCTSYVYALALSNVPDQSRLAIGLGESKILIWNMVKRSYLDMSEIWQKIDGKVMALCFHPTKEGWLGFGTSSGMVGVVDVSTTCKGPFLIYYLEKVRPKESEKNAVYRLQWGPQVPCLDTIAENAQELATKEQTFCLYGTSNMQIYAFTLSRKALKSSPPVNLKVRLDEIDKEAGQPENTGRSDMCWKPDYSAIALANDNGSIYILSPELQLLVSILEHTKLINTLAWHPEFISTYESPCKHWLATGSDRIKVFNVDPSHITQAQHPIATLSLHSNKITNVAWNPHVNGQLLSTSYDNVAQIWDVPNQAPLVSYLGHTSSVMTGLWSPMDPDLIVTGSADGTVQCWRVSKQTTTRPSDKKKKNKSAAEAPVATNDVMSEEFNVEVKGDGVRWKEGVQMRRPKSVFPLSATQLNVGSHLHVLVNRYIRTLNPDNPITIKKLEIEQSKPVESVLEPNPLTETLEKNTDDAKQVNGDIEHVDGVANGLNGVHETNDHSSPEKSADGKDLNEDIKKDGDNSAFYLNFFGSRDDMSNLVQAELTEHINTKYITGAVGTSLWLGDFNVVVKMAMEKEELTDEIVALSQTASLKVWRECCAVYAKQLISHGAYLKATNYLLAIHKIEEAVNLLISQDMYKEAVCLAKLRLPESHELITDGYRAWAAYNASNGNYAQAAHIYLQLEDGPAAMKVLQKSSDVKLQYYACMLALNQSNMAATGNMMLNNCFKRSLDKIPLTFSQEIVEEHPDRKHFRLWYHGRERSAQMLEDPSILSTWAQANISEDCLNIVDKIHADVKDRDISTADVNTLKELITVCEGMDKTKVLLYISGHLAVASMLTDPERLKHILLSLKVASKLQSRVIVFPALINAALYHKGPMANYPLLDRKDSPHLDYITSLRAFFCDAIVNWLYYCEEKNVSSEQMLDIIEHTLENYVEDAINMNTVQYYKAQTDLSTLESALCQQLIMDNIVKKVDSLENLSLFKGKGSKRSSRSNTPEENEQNNEEHVENKEKEAEKNGGDIKNCEKKEDGEINNCEKKEVETKDEEKKKVVEGEIKTELKDKATNDDTETGGKSDAEEEDEVKKEDEDFLPHKKRMNKEELDGDLVEKKPKLEDEVIDRNISKNKTAAKGFDFGNVAEPKYDNERARDGKRMKDGGGGEEEEDEEEDKLSSVEKVQRIKELQEIIAKFERERIYAPNPSRMFELVFKVLNSLGEDVDQLRVRELMELMNTHAEAFELA